ncbi:hypothetical protein [Desulfogranum mediterraneum]|uniref:hypothetical protein n=1 Tax=Desulfogranum mediterraneum TaxID=160661 RepID=UPI000424A2D4|nr:hypothetical protein [Desulfogranum mediterraneum]
MADVNREVYPERTVNEVVGLAREWVEKNYLGTKGFVGAHLVGSINHTPGEALFPLYRDVDIAIVLEGIDYQEIREVSHQGYILECILSGAGRYDGAKKILAEPGMACNLEVDSVLVDPTGKLEKLHREVALDYNKRSFVRLRVEQAEKDAKENLEKMTGAANALEFVFYLGNFIMHCTAMTTLAHLEPPTHRRGLLNLKPMLLADGQEALYERYLQMFGSARLDAAAARLFVEEAAGAFDRALEIKKSPVPYEWKLDPCIRPYLVEGSLEMIEEGGHREAIFWIALFFMISNGVIQQDGNAEEKVNYLAQTGGFLQALGLGSAEELAQRSKECSLFLEDLQAYNRELIASSARLR